MRRERTQQSSGQAQKRVSSLAWLEGEAYYGKWRPVRLQRQVRAVIVRRTVVFKGKIQSDGHFKVMLAERTDRMQGQPLGGWWKQPLKENEDGNQGVPRGSGEEGRPRARPH